MAIRFSPDGHLDVSTDPSDLPGEVTGRGQEYSGAMARCTNLTLDQAGMARTRYGRENVGDAAVSGPLTLMEFGGDRYVFTSAGAIYKNGVSLATGYTGAAWQGFQYSAYNVETESLFVTNGTDRLRITSAGAYQWGIDAPAAAPTLRGYSDVVYTHSWETDQRTTTTRYLESNTWAYTQTWEVDYVGTAFAYYVFPVAQGLYQIDDLLGCFPGDDLAGGTRWQTTEVGWDYPYHLTTSGTTTEYLYAWEGETLDGTDLATPDGQTYHACYAYELPDYALNDIYSVCYTYARYSGTTLECESNPSDVAYVEMSGGNITVGWPASADSQVTHVRVYRTEQGGTALLYAGRFAVANLSGSLQPESDHLGAEVEYDHDRIPAGVLAVAGPDFNGTCFAAVGNKLYFCKAKQPEYWPALYYVEVTPTGQDLTALNLWNGQVYAFSRHRCSAIQGTGADSFFPVPLQVLAGAASATCVAASQAEGIWHLTADGLHVLAGASDLRASDGRFRPIFLGETRGSIPGIARGEVEHSWIVVHSGKVYVGYPDTSSTQPTDVLVLDLGSKRASHYDYGVTLVSACRDLTNDQLLAVDSTGLVWILDEVGTTMDAGSAIAWQVQSKDYGDSLRRYFPRYARWDVEITSGTATGEILLDETVQQVHTLTTREPKKRHVATCNGRRLSLRISGSGVAKIYSAEVE